jgi:hypothetical protein
MTTAVARMGVWGFQGIFQGTAHQSSRFPAVTGARCQVSGKRKRKQFVGHQPHHPRHLGARPTWQHGHGSILQRPRTLKSGTEGALISPRATGRMVSGGFGGRAGSRPLAHSPLSSSPPHTAGPSPPRDFVLGDALNCATCRSHSFADALPLEIPSYAASCIQTPLFRC